MSDLKEHIGRFHIHSTWIEPDRWQKLLPVMAKLVVVRCEQLRHNWCFEYTALSNELFGAHEPTMYVKAYDVQVKLSPLNEIEDVRAVKYENDFFPYLTLEEQQEQLPWRSLRERY